MNDIQIVACEADRTGKNLGYSLNAPINLRSNNGIAHTPETDPSIEFRPFPSCSKTWWMIPVIRLLVLSLLGRAALLLWRRTLMAAPSSFLCRSATAGSGSARDSWRRRSKLLCKKDDEKIKQMNKYRIDK